MSKYIVYGIKNCDTVKKALQWLNAHHIAYTFHDYKTQSISTQTLSDWVTQVGWQNLVNKRGTTWRKLDEVTQVSIDNADAAIELMAHQTSIIKRPLIECEGKVLLLGFDEQEYKQKIS